MDFDCDVLLRFERDGFAVNRPTAETKVAPLVPAPELWDAKRKVFALNVPARIPPTPAIAFEPYLVIEFVSLD